MRRLAALVLGGALALAVVAPALAATPVYVPATAGWVDTGLEVAGGDSVNVDTRGFATTAFIPDWLVPGQFISGSGPAGQANGALCGDYEPLRDLCFVQDAYYGELVGRVGGVTFAIGSTSAIEIPAGASGQLELAVNDYDVYLADNHGGFLVIIR